MVVLMSTTRRRRAPSPPVRWRVGLRGAALLPAGGLAVDLLRYLLAYRGGAGEVFVAEGHGYLGLLMPAIAAAPALALGAFVARLVRAWRGTGEEAGAGASLPALWIVC